MIVYQPDMSIAARFKRHLTPLSARRPLEPKAVRPIVSFSFDDCPKSVIENAIKPLEQENWRSSVYIAMGLCGITNHLGLHMDAADVTALHSSGHEIGDHTFSHIDAEQHNIADYLVDIDKNQAALNAIDVPKSKTFAYPYGQVTRALKQKLGVSFKGSRCIRGRECHEYVDLNQIRANRLYARADFNKLLDKISRIDPNKPGWLPIFTHDVRENPSPFGCTPKQMLKVIKAVKESGAQVLTMAEAIDTLELAND